MWGRSAALVGMLEHTHAYSDTHTHIAFLKMFELSRACFNYPAINHTVRIILSKCQRCDWLSGISTDWWKDIDGMN